MDTETKCSWIIAIICSVVMTITMITSVLDTGSKCECGCQKECGASEIILDTSSGATEIIANTNDLTDTTSTSSSESPTSTTDDMRLTDTTEQDVSLGHKNLSVPSNNSIKSYMDYGTITSKSSRQYALQKSKAYTGEHGIRMVNDRYCIALGSYYTTTIGQHVDVELENGNVIYGILADCKDNKHTDSTNRINPNGSVVEFIVDTNKLDNTAKIMGDISYINGWDSKVVNIKVYDKVEEF